MKFVRRRQIVLPLLNLKSRFQQKKINVLQLIFLILVSHPAIFQVSYNHNHPIESAHSLSFRPIHQETKEFFFKLLQSQMLADFIMNGGKMNLGQTMEKSYLTNWKWK